MQEREFAVNVADLTRYDNILIACMVVPVTQRKILVNANPKAVDEGAVVLECDEQQAKSIIAFLRDEDKRQKRYPLRAYWRKKAGGARPGAWRRIPYNEKLP